MRSVLILFFLLSASFPACPQSRTIAPSGWRLIIDENISTENTNLIQSYLEEAKKYYRIEWGLKLPEMISVHVYNTSASFQKASHQSRAAAASWDGSTVHIQNPSVIKKRNVLQETIIHEIAHIALQSRWKQRAPVWFEEGFAVYCANEIASLPRPRKSIDRLGSFGDEKIKTTGLRALQHWYATAGTLVFIFIREMGKENLRQMLSPGSDASFEECVATAMKMPYHLFEKKLIKSFNLYIGITSPSH